MKNTGKTFVRAAALCLVLLCVLATSACSHSTVYGETVTPTTAPEQVPATEEKKADLPETEAPEVKTVRATVTAGGVTVSLDVPEGWTFEEDKEFEERAYDAAITLCTDGAPGSCITVGYSSEGLGVCGWCLESEAVTLSGIEGVKMSYTDLPEYPWEYFKLGNVWVMNRGFTNDQWAIYGDEIMAILDTITVTEG